MTNTITAPCPISEEDRKDIQTFIDSLTPEELIVFKKMLTNIKNKLD